MSFTIPDINREYRIIPDNEISHLNDEQKKVVNSPMPLIVIAGPGSGKTETITQKIAKQFIRNVNDLKRSLILTFTNAAAAEILERISKTLDISINRTDFYTGTFHGVFLKILRDNNSMLSGLVKYPSNLTILDQSDNEAFIKSACIEVYCKKYPDNKKPKVSEIEEFLNMEISEFSHHITSTSNYPHNSIQDYYAKVVNRIAPPKYDDEPQRKANAKEILQLYFKLKFNQNAIAFGDILLYMYLGLKSDLGFRKYVSDMFDQIVIDEYQDTNPIQSACIDLIHKNNYCKIGDPYQSIYRFMGAELKNIMSELTKKGVHKIQLIKNYRSSSNIISATNSIASTFIESVDAIPCTAGNSSIENNKIELYQVSNENLMIYKLIEEYKEKGKALHDQCVLIRSRAASYGLESILMSNGVPYIKIGGTSFFDLAEIKPLLALTKILIGKYTMKDFEKAAGLFPGVGASSIDKIISTFIINNGEKPLIDIIDEEFPKNMKVKNIAKYILDKNLFNNMSIVDRINNVMNIVGYVNIILKKSSAKSQRDLDIKKDTIGKNVDILMEQISYFESAGLLETFLENATLDKKEKADVKDKLIICTMHSAKGLEWDTCYIMGLSFNGFPRVDEINHYEYEEEKRLFYVSVSRAKANLHITFKGYTSSFLNALIDLPYVNKKVVTFNEHEEISTIRSFDTGDEFLDYVELKNTDQAKQIFY